MSKKRDKGIALDDKEALIRYKQGLSTYASAPDPVEHAMVRQEKPPIEQPNIGWLFNRDYFQGVPYVAAEDTDNHFKQKNDRIFSAPLVSLEPIYKEFIDSNTQSFPLTTQYPGLLAGAGYSHETGSEGEIKLGFSFDHTYGVPYIPASSIKGILRSAFKEHNRWVIDALLEHENCALANEEKQKVKELDKDDFVRCVFEGKKKVDSHANEWKEKNIYERDIFHDAFPIRIEDNLYTSPEDGATMEKRLLGPDVLCPHENPLKNPVPITFMKVMPNVVFQFVFDLKDDDLMKADLKRKLFKEIFKFYGAGAKTNVGYGQFK